ncbi:Hypothetical predicted protein [Olea europaea subsp. europaea]|uniref:Uncharacterized protein n=1 Tax=Olea europaea subsp. europaea TaxID=158383 RepID=A0A8S0PG80_OLEEU|nr:Hypothetical predicted protein [Olea europaea subsp. europaea]
MDGPRYFMALPATQSDLSMLAILEEKYRTRINLQINIDLSKARDKVRPRGPQNLSPVLSDHALSSQTLQWNLHKRVEDQCQAA